MIQINDLKKGLRVVIGSTKGFIVKWEMITPYTLNFLTLPPKHISNVAHVFINSVNDDIDMITWGGLNIKANIDLDYYNNESK
jgi:hypothetical protein